MILPFHDDAARRAAAARVAGHLRADGLIAYPTETVYGFGCALRPTPLARLAALKGRGSDKAMLLLVRGESDVGGVRWTPAARTLAAAFWPGPLTLALRAEPDRWPREVVGPRGTVAFRATPHPAVLAILDALGEPITSTSANPPGVPPASTAQEAAEALRRLGDPEGFWVLDGGVLPASPPSTLVDCSRPAPVIARTGAVDPARIAEVLKSHE